MKLDVVASSGNDEFYTPKYAVSPIIEYIEKDKIVWCPFDTNESNFVKMFQEIGIKVVYSHLDNGTDFFNCDVPNCDCIVSNPPYSLKTEVFERLFNINKPFAMLVGVVGLFESKRRFNLFKNNDFEIMYFNKRISYFKDYKEQKPSLNPPFSSVYVCKNILPKSVVFANLSNAKTQVSMFDKED